MRTARGDAIQLYEGRTISHRGKGKITRLLVQAPDANNCLGTTCTLAGTTENFSLDFSFRCAKAFMHIAQSCAVPSSSHFAQHIPVQRQVPCRWNVEAVPRVSQWVPACSSGHVSSLMKDALVGSPEQPQHHTRQSEQRKWCLFSSHDSCKFSCKAAQELQHLSWMP